MVNDTPRWLHTVAAIHAAEAKNWREDGVTIHRVGGGFNNALYRVETGTACYACKLCVVDKRHRAAQEYGAMHLLHVAGQDVAPEPLRLDQSCAVVPFPVVIYRWLPGAPLQMPLTAQQLPAFLDSLERIHTLRPGHWDLKIKDSWFHKFDFDWYLAELGDFLTQYGPWLETTEPSGAELHGRLARLIDRCAWVVADSDVDPSRERVALGLCRVDANLANTVWGTDGRLRWVDWEFSGWGDLALDLADLRWHVALVGLGEAGHRCLRENYRRPDDDPTFDARMGVWDQLIVTRWCFLTLRWLWSQYNGLDRLRLTWQAEDPAQVYARLVRFIERAERFR